MTSFWKTVRLVVVVAAYGAIGYSVWKRLKPAKPLPASPYPPAGAKASGMPSDPVGPVEPALIAADDAETERIAAEVRPEEGIDLSTPLAVGDVDRTG